MIDLRDYDLAMFERIKSFYENTHWIMRPNIPIKDIRDRKVLNGEDIDYPVITVRRSTCPIISTEYNSWSRGRVGDPYINKPNDTGDHNIRNIDKNLAASLGTNGLEIVNSTYNLVYYLDVISFERDNFDTILIELQENLFRIPYIYFKNIKSDTTQDKLIPNQACHLLLEEVEDTSDLENFDSGNAMYRATLTLKVNAYIYRKCKIPSVQLFAITTKVTSNTIDESIEDIIVSSQE